MSKEQKKIKRKELGVQECAKPLLSVGDLNANKNHEIVMRALSRIEDNVISK